MDRFGMGLNIGDKVKIVKPNNRGDGPGWGHGMDKYNNTVQTVKAVLVSGEFFIEDDPSEFLFSGDWCVKV